jgi:hypothetical protein
MRAVDLHHLNRSTRYPDIPSYHARDPDTQQLLDHPNRAAGEILITEKIDGVQARLVLLPDGYLIGDRTRFLYAQGDLIANPSQSIVKTLRPTADALANRLPVNSGSPHIVVAYGEVYGGTTTSASEHYTSKRELGFRVFDVAHLDDSANLSFLSEDDLQGWTSDRGLKLAPRVARITMPDVPKSLAATRTFLEEVLPVSKCRLDGSASGEPEGLVLRKADRSWIVSLRASDYRKKRR